MRYLSTFTLALFVCSPAASAVEPIELSVMTFNLRYASDTPPNDWAVRRPVVAELLRQFAPDVLGTQEGLYRQLTDLSDDLPEYDWIGLGRVGGSRGEFMAVFYLRERLEPLEYDHFWLSDTPEVIGSASWGNNVRRMVTWVRFRERATGGEFYFVNTHFDHQSQPSRERSAELVARRIEAWQTDLPVLLVGDFNAIAGDNPVYDRLVSKAGFTDTWTAAAERGPQVATFHNYVGPIADGPRIDWILARGRVESLSSEIVTYARDGQYPSDHFPVAARLRLGE